jgi:hypothetical protein
MRVSARALKVKTKSALALLRSADLDDDDDNDDDDAGADDNDGFDALPENLALTLNSVEDLDGARSGSSALAAAISSSESVRRRAC